MRAASNSSTATGYGRALIYSREAIQRPTAQATAYVEWERRQYVGFVIDGGRVQRVIETPDREQARVEAEARAARINTTRSKPTRSRA
ncbi:hypothetical protein [Nevskia sp.]|uniref:hypothetical protein n=1 Tax=Nevskia sp. TaxID=1929292 RepID=UPI0025F14227|nr:hypothetical protein [Nevskia sp.]